MSASPDAPALELRGLTKRYDDGTVAIENFDLTVPAGSFFGLAVPLTGVPVERPFALAAAVVLGLVLFGALGTVVGIFAEQWDHTTFISNILILPLTFVGGVFYSVEVLPSPWEELSHVNPIFYLVNAVRFGFLGTSDVSVWLCLGITAALAVPAYLWSQWLFSSGRRLKP